MLIRMTVAEFIENFVGHNSIINLYKSKVENVEENCIKYTKIWSGMDWQCSDNSEDIESLNRREIEVCPYRHNRVVQIKQFPHQEFSDYIDLLIEE